MAQRQGTWMGAAVATAVLATTFIAGPQLLPARAQSAAAPQSVINDPNLIFPATRLIDLNGRAFRFDTSTGELMNFSGTLTGRSAVGTWVRFARAVTDTTSGFLDLQEVGGAIFLVDLN